MSRRRRSADFSHLLQSVCDATDCGTDLITREGLSTARQDIDSEKTRLDDETSSGGKFDDDDSTETCSYKSTILAGQAVDVRSRGSTENSYRTAHSGSTSERPIVGNVSAETCRSEVPSFMNKAINLRFAPQSDLDLSQCSEKSCNDSRDTNYNIKNDLEIATTSSTHRAPYRRADSPKYGTTVGRMASDNDSEQILKRLTQEFVSSPRRFTERLVTIIDETESGYANDDDSGVNLSRVTQEFQKMCKYIQDESMPEHMNSILGISRKFDDTKPPLIERPETIEESPIEASSTNDEARTPDIREVTRKIYRKTPLKLFRKNARDKREADSPGSPNSTRYFVHLEKYLSEQQPTSPRAVSSRPIVRDSSSGDITERRLMDKMSIVEKGEQQLASLDDTDDRAFETFDSHHARGAEERGAYEPRVDRDVPEKLVGDRAIDADELTESVRLELEKQRERCFETALQMQKIEEDAIACNEDYTRVFERYGIDSENECRKTIDSLLTYQFCWSRIRRNDRARRNEASVIDSGIDARSVSSTHLRASNKKSFNDAASLRGSAKNGGKSGICTKFSRTTGTPLNPRSNGSRSGSAIGGTNGALEPVATRVAHPKNSRRLAAARRRSPGNLCPTVEALRRSRARGGESLGQPFETKLTPRLIVDRLETPKEHSTPVSSKNVRASSGRNPRATPGGTKDTRSPYRVASSGASPTVRSCSKDRIAKPESVGRTETPSSTRIAKSPRNRFFVTPGKTVPIRETRRRSKLFFPTLNDDLQLEGPARIIKSPHAPGIYREGMSTVISPLRMYIRGTDTNLVQNVPPRTNEMIITPTKAAVSAEKLRFRVAAGTLNPRSSPFRATPFTREKDSESQSDDNDENTREPEFVIAKRNYKLPARVHAIDKSPRNVGGAFFRGLLQPMENRVAVRHEGRIHRRYGRGDAPGSDSEPNESSVHVQRSAKKMNYLDRRK